MCGGCTICTKLKKIVLQQVTKKNWKNCANNFFLLCSVFLKFVGTNVKKHWKTENNVVRLSYSSRKRRQTDKPKLQNFSSHVLLLKRQTPNSSFLSSDQESRSTFPARSPDFCKNNSVWSDKIVFLTLTKPRSLFKKTSKKNFFFLK